MTPIEVSSILTAGPRDGRRPTAGATSVIAALGLFLTGCATTLPDLTSFSTRTSGMVSAVDAGLRETGFLLADAAAPESGQREFSATKDRLAAVFHALPAYADALNSIAQAGRSGEESARALADALGGLLSAAGGAPLQPVVTGAFVEANRVVAAVRARRALAEAVMTAQPAIDTIAAAGVDLVETLRTLSRSALLEMENRERARNQPLVDYIALLGEEESRQLVALTLFIEARNGSDKARTALLETDSVLARLQERGTAIRPEDLEKREAEVLKLSASTRAQLNAYRVRHEAALSRLTAVSHRRIAAEELFRSCRLALRAWQRAHRKVSDALHTGKPAEFGELAAADRGLRDLIQQGDRP